MNDRSDGVPAWVVILLVFLALGLGAAGGGVLGFVAGMKVGGAFDFTDAFIDPENIVTSAECPEKVQVGETFEIAVRVRNTAQEPQTLFALDFYPEYFDGFEVLASDPPAGSVEDNSDFVTWYYGIPLAPGGEQVVRLKLKAVEPGAWAGDLDVCINNELSFLTNYVETQVVPPEDSASDTGKKDEAR